MGTPWYRNGLEFGCTRCGHCCTGEPGYVWLSKAELEALASYVGLTVEEFSRRYVRRVGRKLSLIEKPNGDCVFYEEGCTVYPVRPRQCRTFPFWPENLRSREAWLDATRDCPGTGRGRLYALEEIERLRRGEGET